MTVSTIGAASFPMGSGNSSSTKTTSDSYSPFASLLTETFGSLSPDQVKHQAKIEKNTYMKQRIAEVGIHQYVAEQKQVNGLMDTLKSLAANTQDAEVKTTLKTFVTYFEAHPPKNTGEMLSLMASEMANANKDLKEKLEALLTILKQMTDLSDDLLDALAGKVPEESAADAANSLTSGDSGGGLGDELSKML